MSLFSRNLWQRSADVVAARAFREVPFYREMWAARSSLPVVSGELDERLFALCPLARPFDPAREPTLWTGVPGDLAAVLRIAGFAERSAVVEVRASLVDWRRLGPAGPRYACALAPDAVGVDAARLAASDQEAILLSRNAVLVGPRSALDAVGERIGHRGRRIARLSMAEAADGASKAGGPKSIGSAGMVFDRHLGYFAAWMPSCGRWHVSWRRFHVGFADGRPVVTALWRRRPTLVQVVPAEPGFTDVVACPEHRTPTLV